MRRKDPNDVLSCPKAKRKKKRIGKGAKLLRAFITEARHYERQRRKLGVTSGHPELD